MKILDLKVLKGPNYWSNYRRKLIVMKLDIGIYESLPTIAIPGFTERLTELIPSLYSHRCSVGAAGGFIKRMQEGTWLGHVIEHVALELQSLAGMDCGFGRTRSTDKTGVYDVVFSYLIENAGIYAAKAAIELTQAVASGQPYNLKAAIEELSDIFYQEALGPSTQSLVTEAENRGIPVTRLDKGSFVMLGQGKNQKLIRATIACTTNNIAVEVAGDKAETKKILGDNYIPVPGGLIITNPKALDEAVNKLGYPLVIKPLNGNHGRGITTNINSKEQAVNALIQAKRISDGVIIEKYINGDDYRFLVINYKLAAVSKRTPAMVTGDGRSTIEQLIHQVNSDPNRGEGHEKVLTKIRADQNTQSILMKNKLTLNSVLPAGVVLKLKDTANISSGGTATDVTEIVHPQNRLMAERTARLIGLDICGIDIISDDISKPIAETNGAVLEVNAAPGFRMHSHPSSGQARNVAVPVIDMLFPAASKSRIPLVAVTGTNGKTTTTRLIAHLSKCAGYVTGFTSTDGIYIDQNLITAGDCSGPASAAVVLRDPAVDFAVFECARGGILRSGLGFDYCNVSVVTNVTEDHLGIGGINTLQQLAKVKSVVPQSTFDDGYAVLNADDDLVFAMKDNLSCKIALYSRDPENIRITAHRHINGLAAVIEDEQFVLYNGNVKTAVTDIKDVPLTLNGRSNCMIQNALAALLAAYASGISIEILRSGLHSFIPSAEMTPGRMNIFQFSNFRVIIDYVHNKGGFQELKDYLAKETASVKTGIIGAPGDRRDQDIILIGQFAGEIFDEIIIRHDKDSRDRSNSEISELLTSGILKAGRKQKITIISDEGEAIRHACKHAANDTLIFVCSDEIKDTLQLITDLKNNENITVNHGS
jgi:cyanophycin synthetase